MKDGVCGAILHLIRRKMTLKTQFTVGATMVGLVAALVLVQGVRDTINENGKGKVTVTGMWINSPRADMVEISVSVGAATKTTRHITAPFGPKVYIVPRGTRVMIRLRLLGTSGAKFLGCIAEGEGGDKMETPPHSGVGPGAEAMCWAVA